MTNSIVPRGHYGDALGRRLVLKLSRDPAGQVSVLACEVISSSFTNRTVFHGKSGLFDVLVDDLAAAVSRMLQALNGRRQVVSLPEFLLELPDLILSSVHMIVSEAADGAQKILLRFKRAFGHLGGALRARIGFDGPAPAAAEEIATDVLADIATPLLNLCRAPAPNGLREEQRMYQAQQNLADRAEEIAFYAELLKRYVRGSAQQPAPAPARLRAVGVDSAAPRPRDRRFESG